MGKRQPRLAATFGCDSGTGRLSISRRSAKKYLPTLASALELSASGYVEFDMPRDGNGNGGGNRRAPSRNVLGERLESCSIKPMTGFFRNGCCDTSREDVGSHTVCIVATAEFLRFSKSCGNDLSTPVPEYGFAGLKPGDRWCLCAPRWQEALDAGEAPRVVLRATHEGALNHCELADLKRFAVDLS